MKNKVFLIYETSYTDSGGREKELRGIYTSIQLSLTIVSKDSSYSLYELEVNKLDAELLLIAEHK